MSTRRKGLSYAGCSSSEYCTMVGPPRTLPFGLLLLLLLLFPRWGCGEPLPSSSYSDMSSASCVAEMRKKTSSWRLRYALALMYLTLLMVLPVSRRLLTLAYLGFDGTRRSSFASNGELRRCMVRGWQVGGWLLRFEGRCKKKEAGCASYLFRKGGLLLLLLLLLCEPMTPRERVLVVVLELAAAVPAATAGRSCR